MTTATTIILILLGLIGWRLLQLGITQILTLNWTREGEAITNNVTLTIADEINHDVSLSASESNQAVDTELRTADLQVIYIDSDAHITLKANSSSAGDADFILSVSADEPLLWYQGGGITSPITADVETWYVSTLDGDGATVKIRAGH